MKVRCIDNSGGRAALSIGKVYEVDLESSTKYRVLNDIGSITEYMKDRFEIVEHDSNMQEKTFREVIAYIKEGEVWESAQGCFQLKEISCIGGRILFKLVGVFVEKTDNINSVDTGAGSGQTFKLQRKQYTFAEAFKAYEEGKEIENNWYRYKRIDNKDALFNEAIKDWRIMSSLSIELREIRGKWYINN